MIKRFMPNLTSILILLHQVIPEEYIFEVPFDCFPKGGYLGKTPVRKFIELNTETTES